MAVSSLNSNYYNALYQWQGQSLKSTGSGSTSSSSNSLSSLFGGSSMTSQISSMVELTKYAMDAMGVGSDSRVTFSQITKYREQLISQFNQGVKNGLASSGIQDMASLTYTLDANGKITVSGSNSGDVSLAQSWLNANSTYGESLRASLAVAGVEKNTEVSFKLSSTGKMTVVDSTSQKIQAALDKNENLTASVRDGLAEAGIAANGSLSFSFNNDGVLVVAEDTPGANKINEWLAANPQLADEVASVMEKNGMHASSATLRLPGEGNIQITVVNQANNEIQSALDKEMATGQKIYAALSDQGIDPNISFSLQVNDDGTVSVISDHADAAKLQKFFDENPDLVKKYRQIETLAGLDDARKAMKISPAEMRKRIQIESMASWWASSGNSDSYFGQYSANNGLSLLSGLNLTV